jgi:hypothetical protein
VWPAADLRRRLLDSLRIAHRAVQLLGEKGFQDKETGRGFSPDKVVSETALLLMASSTLASTDGAGPLSAAHDRLARALIPFARSERVRAAICIRPAALGELSFAHSCLTSLGYPDDQFEDLVEAARSSEAVASRERLPHRMMEQEWIHRTVTPSSMSTPALARWSLLGLGLDALASTRDDVYAFTHAVMYLTDFGARRSRLPRTWAAIEADAVASLAFSLDAQDYDLSGEVLLTWPMLRRAWTPAATFGMHLLAQVEDEAGFLPPPGITTDHYLRLSNAERSTVVLADVYHTACVMGLLSTAALRERCAPPATIAETGQFQGASEAILELVDRSADARPAAHWRGFARTLSPGQRDALSPLFLAICLRRGATTLNLPIVRDALRVAARHGLLDAPAPRQALQLLDRATRAAGRGGSPHSKPAALPREAVPRPAIEHS